VGTDVKYGRKISQTVSTSQQDASSRRRSSNKVEVITADPVPQLCLLL
jgi:hypothetical protein